MLALYDIAKDDSRVLRDLHQDGLIPNAATGFLSSGKCAGLDIGQRWMILGASVTGGWRSYLSLSPASHLA